MNPLLAEIPATLGLKAALAIGEAQLRMENMVMVGSGQVWGRQMSLLVLSIGKKDDPSHMIIFIGKHLQLSCTSRTRNMYDVISAQFPSPFLASNKHPKLSARLCRTDIADFLLVYIWNASITIAAESRCSSSRSRPRRAPRHVAYWPTSSLHYIIHDPPKLHNMPNAEFRPSARIRGQFTPSQ